MSMKQIGWLMNTFFMIGKFYRLLNFLPNKYITLLLVIFSPNNELFLQP